MKCLFIDNKYIKNKILPYISQTRMFTMQRQSVISVTTGWGREIWAFNPQLKKMDVKRHVQSHPVGNIFPLRLKKEDE